MSNQRIRSNARRRQPNVMPSLWDDPDQQLLDHLPLTPYEQHRERLWGSGLSMNWAGFVAQQQENPNAFPMVRQYNLDPHLSDQLLDYFPTRYDNLFLKIHDIAYPDNQIVRVLGPYMEILRPDVIIKRFKITLYLPFNYEWFTRSDQRQTILNELRVHFRASYIEQARNPEWQSRARELYESFIQDIVTNGFIPNAKDVYMSRLKNHINNLPTNSWNSVTRNWDRKGDIDPITDQDIQLIDPLEYVAYDILKMLALYIESLLILDARGALP